MKNIVDYIHTIPGITAQQVNTLVELIDQEIEGALEHGYSEGLKEVKKDKKGAKRNG